MRVLSIVMLVLWVCSAAAAEDTLAQEDTATLWAALRAGGHVALVRHGATAGGAGDPPGFRLDDCATQRNLNDKGRAEARRLGEQFRGEDVAVGKLMSSQWCRCQETAALMDLGLVELRDSIYETSSNCRALSEIAKRYIAAGGLKQSAPCLADRIAEGARAKAWMALAVSRTGDPNLMIW
jgi:hypothetical protein